MEERSGGNTGQLKFDISDGSLKFKRHILNEVLTGILKGLESMSCIVLFAN